MYLTYFTIQEYFIYMNYVFYCVAFLLIVLSCAVISSKNPVYSVLFLILVFVHSSILFIMLDAEFIAMILIIVYVGAVAVLFLFIVVMLGVKNVIHTLRKTSWLMLVISGLLLCELFAVYFSSFTNTGYETNISTINTATIGKVLYTDYFYVFQIAGLILLVAMIGSIILTLQHRNFIRKQDVFSQLSRKSTLKKVKSCC